MSVQQQQQTLTQIINVKANAESEARRDAIIKEEKRLGQPITQYDPQMLRIYANTATADDLQITQTSIYRRNFSHAQRSE